MSTKKRPNGKPKDREQIAAWLPAKFHKTFKDYVGNRQIQAKTIEGGAHIPTEREIIQIALFEYMKNNPLKK